MAAAGSSVPHFGAFPTPSLKGMNHHSASIIQRLNDERAYRVPDMRAALRHAQHVRGQQRVGAAAAPAGNRSKARTVSPGVMTAPAGCSSVALLSHSPTFDFQHTLCLALSLATKQDK